MIDETKIKEFKQVAISGPTVEIDYALPDIFETMEKLWKVARAAESALGWMNPIMDGFSIPKDAEARTKVLNPLKEAIATLYEPVDKIIDPKPMPCGCVTWKHEKC